MNSIIKKTLLLSSVLCLTLFNGCGGSKNKLSDSNNSTKIGGTKSQVTIAINSEPSNGFDPTIGWGHGTSPIIQSTLVELTQDMHIVNDLATEYKISDDILTWVFTIRKDAHFTDGEPVTASDVAFTFNTAKNSQSSLDLSYMETCKATGEHEVTFTLSSPTITFLNTIASVGIVPEHLYNESYYNEPIGSGPWKFVQWNKGEQVILEANEDYYGNVPAIKKVILVFMDEDAAFAAAMSGQVDVALTSAANATNEINGMRIEAVSTLDNRGFTLPTTPSEGNNTESGYPIGNNVTCHLTIRQAIAYSINREQIAQDAVYGYATPAYSENDGMPWNNPEVKIETNVEYAKQLLENDGWQDTDDDGIVEKDGLKAEFTCIYPSGDSARQAVAMAAAQQVKEIGINIIVEGTSWDDISKRMFSESVLMGWGSSNPFTSYLLYHSSNMLKNDYYNPEGFLNNTVDTYLEAAIHADSIETANKQWQLAQWDGTTGTSMKGDCPWVWLVNMKHIYYVSDNLDIGNQQLHAHGADWTLIQNLRDWTWK